MKGEPVEDAREIVLERLKADLMGPASQDEVISDRPSDRYLTGILFARRTDLPPEEDDESGESAEKEEGESLGLDAVRACSTFRPSSAGISFAAAMAAEGPARLRLRVSGGRYESSDVEEEAPEGQKSRRKTTIWTRKAMSAEFIVNLRAPPKQALSLAEEGIPGISLTLRLARLDEGAVLVTMALSNDVALPQTAARRRREEAAFFQASLEVACDSGACFIPKPERAASADAEEEEAAAALLYRNIHRFAVGHICSAGWEAGEDGEIERIRTEWFPQTLVHAVSASGDAQFARIREAGASGPLGASWLAQADREPLLQGLTDFVDRYAAWIGGEEARKADPPAALQAQAEAHLVLCRSAERRMREGIALLAADPQALEAFRLANGAVALQASWRPGAKSEGLIWRPFQLGFALLCAESIAREESPSRDVMDLLWFPTGGGKTEAYLLLTAFTIFLRRLRAKGAASGAGVTVFMRYTLRLLTIQQFERAAALICACEQIRKGAAKIGVFVPPAHFASDARISLGLWVGEGATPNRISDAISALAGTTEGGSTPAQLHACPACHEPVLWRPAQNKDRIEALCENAACPLGAGGGLLPLWTVDDDVYREQPSLIIGTVDKYAQIARNQDSGRLFGRGTACAPPSLIVQDELHLISGPLGSLAGLYEAAVDELCRSSAGFRPKVIGSTATIRQASRQIAALFDRKSFQFPPAGLDHANSGFAVEDRSGASGPGRLYVGLTTAGRSAKFAMQALAGSCLQSVEDFRFDEASRDGFSTLVAYYNSLRELGGSLVVMRGDVERSREDYAARRGERTRRADEQVELTSRISSDQIPKTLGRLARKLPDPEHVDVVLASNMISVGVDVPRLGLMMVYGQPKTIAEYIQATSRVGRDSRSPGLILTLYNAAKSRDRSRYEAFSSWHQSLYREVEATSVTPFAPRACDRALHAPLVAMIRHLASGMASPEGIADYEEQVEDLLEKLLARIARLDPSEEAPARRALGRFLDDWFDQPPQSYWSDYEPALLISAEKAAERGGQGYAATQRPTPNSLRTVEASSLFVLLEREREAGGEDA